MKLNRYIIIAGSVIFLLCAFATYAQEYSQQDLNGSFEKAGELYAASDFKGAIDEYEKIVDHGYESGSIYYNIGNAYFKVGSIGKAILNYERAKRLMPYDRDLRSNLEYLYSLVEESPMDRTRVWFTQNLRNFLELFPVDPLTIFVCIIYLSAISLLIVHIFVKNARPTLLRLVAVMSVLFLVALTILSVNITRIEHTRRGIVIEEEVEVRFEPREGAVINFKLNEGATVYALRDKGEWTQVKREDGKIGWLKNSFYDLI